MGFSLMELLIIAAVALLVVGPKDLPILLRRLGTWAGRARNMLTDIMEPPPQPPHNISHVIIGDEGKAYEAYPPPQEAPPPDHHASA